MRIYSLELGRLRKNEHFQLMTDVATLLLTIPTDVAAKFKVQLDAFATAVADEKMALKKIMKSVLTAQIAEADAARDVVFRGLVDNVQSSRHHFNNEVRVVAERVANTITAYDNVAKMGDVEGTSALYNLLKDLTDRHAEDVIALGLTTWIDELNKLNKAVEALRISRAVEAAERQTEATKDVRRRADEAYRTITLCLETFSIIETADNVAALEKLIASLNAIIENYSNTVAIRRGIAKAAAERKKEEEDFGENSYIICSR